MQALEQAVVDVQQGVWIDAYRLRKAGLGKQLQIVVRPGMVQILSKTAPSETILAEPQEASALGWEIFRALGNDAQPGRLPDTAVDHDRYLYSRE
ncbi:MAG: hypothetical protein FJ011_27560 [Chloroflexi bacterium]|nr:hypothetical protein [Chloroflexota bacterium]